MNGAERIAAERKRQVDELDWTAGHDDEHQDGELVSAALCYAASAIGKRIRLGAGAGYDPWPWIAGRPIDAQNGDASRVRCLEKAGALMAAEIDRLLRASGDAQREEPRGRYAPCPCGHPEWVTGEDGTTPIIHGLPFCHPAAASGDLEVKP